MSKSAVIPLRDEFVVKADSQSAVSKGGIIIPTELGDKPRTGTVVSVGPGTTDAKGKRIDPIVSVGDRVLFGMKDGVAVGEGSNGLFDRSFLLLKPHHIIGKIGD